MPLKYAGVLRMLIMLVFGVTLTRAAFLGSLMASSSSFLRVPSNNNYIMPPRQHQVSLASNAKATRRIVDDLVQSDPTLAGPLIRLAFHDAATFQRSLDERSSTNAKAATTSIGGPNGSIQFEIDMWSENRGLSRPFQVVQEIRRQSTSIKSDMTGRRCCTEATH